MHFGLYAFDLFIEIYREAWASEIERGPGSLDVSTYSEVDLKPLGQTYATYEAFLHDVPRLIVEHNIFGVDIDPRAAQIASLALWLRAQRAWHEAGVKAKDRPFVGRGNVVAAIAPPAEVGLRREFATGLDSSEAQLFERTLQLLKSLPELGVLLRLEHDLPKLVRQVFGRVGDMFKEGHASSWASIELDLRTALTNFASASKSTYQGRLFAQDALQGLRLIDIASGKYDVLVMNPPFGLPAANAKSFLKEAYPDSWSDYYNAFITRATELVGVTGRFGAVVPNRLLYTKKSSAVRDLLSSKWSVRVLVDAGRDVMDDAAVDALFFVAAQSGDPQSLQCPVLDLKGTDPIDRPGTLLNWSRNPSKSIDFGYFRSIPGNSFAYAAPIEYLQLWRSGKRLDPNLATVATGGKTFDDARFLRLRWEVPANSIGSKWLSVDTGGDYQMWFSPSAFVQNWAENGREMRTFANMKHGTDAQVMQSSKHWFKAGIAYPYTSSIGFGPRILPRNTIFSSDAIAIIPHDSGDALPLLGLLASDWTSELLDCLGEGRKTENSLVKSMPLSVSEGTRASLDATSLEAVRWMIGFETMVETSPYFWSPKGAVPSAGIIVKLAGAFHDLIEPARAAFGISRSRVPISSNSKLIANYISEYDESAEAAAEMSYLVGVAYGRWNIECYKGKVEFTLPEDVFQELPILEPGKLALNRELESVTILGINGGDKCLAEIVRGSLRKIYGPAAESREVWLLNALGFESLEIYLKNPSGFFSDHLKRYSRGARRAPIYWLVATPSGSFTICINYLNISNQTLFSAINDFVDPRLEQTRLNLLAIRGRGLQSQDAAKALEALQRLEVELAELRKVLLTTAQGYAPQHDDGVLICAAPLWPLIAHKPWQKQLKDAWTKLENGDFDWARLAYSYWPRRIREKCKDDKSLAIAHGLESVYVEPQGKPRKFRAKSLGDAE